MPEAYHSSSKHAGWEVGGHAHFDVMSVEELEAMPPQVLAELEQTCERLATELLPRIREVRAKR